MQTIPTMLPSRAFIDGEFVDARSGETFDTYCPASGEVLTPVAACGPGDVEDAVRSARTAFERGTWRRMAPAERKTILLKFADLIDANAAEIAPRRD
jgi:4-(gamma-glutamylamino)butanal dehydrogenase